MKVRNTFIIFLVSGFWHGANWTFIAWGGLNAMYFLPLLLLKRNRTNLGVVAEGRMLPNIRELWQIGTTFSLTVFAWIFFRAENLVMALDYITLVFKKFDLIPERLDNERYSFEGILFPIIFIFFDWQQRDKPFKDYWYYIFIVAILLLGKFTRYSNFIYFQF